MKEKLKNWSLYVPKYFRYSSWNWVWCFLYLLFGFSALIGSYPIISVLWFSFAYSTYTDARHQFHGTKQRMMINDQGAVIEKLSTALIRAKADTQSLCEWIDNWHQTEGECAKDRIYYGEELEEEKKPDIKIGGPGASH